MQSRRFSHSAGGRSEFEGFGVGLAGVKRIVARLGGEIWAEPSPGEGARFFFTLQSEPEAAAALAATELEGVILLQAKLPLDAPGEA